MSLDIGEAIEKGIESALNRNSAILMSVFFIVSLISQAMGDTIGKNLLEQGKFDPAFSEAMSQFSVSELAPMALGLSTEVAAIGAFLTGILSLLITLGTVRAFLEDGPLDLKASYFTDNIPWMLANILAGGLIFSLALTAGFIAFIIPGLFLFVSLFFWSLYVIDQEMNFLEAMKAVWNDVKGERLMISALLLIVFIGVGVFSAVIGGLLSLLGSLTGSLAVGSALGLIPSAIAMVFTWAIFTEAYKQISE